MRRLTFNALSFLSALLCAATILLWLRSYFYEDRFSRQDVVGPHGSIKKLRWEMHLKSASSVDWSVASLGGKFFWWRDAYYFHSDNGDIGFEPEDQEYLSLREVHKRVDGIQIAKQEVDSIQRQGGRSYAGFAFLCKYRPFTKELGISWQGSQRCWYTRIPCPEWISLKGYRRSHAP